MIFLMREILRSITKGCVPLWRLFWFFSRTGQEVISAKLIKEIAVGGGDLSELVPEVTIRYIKKKLKETPSPHFI